MKPTLYIIVPLWIFVSIYSFAFEYDDQDRRDPFLPLVDAQGNYLFQLETKSQSVGDVKLEGILYDPVEGSAAIINGDIVKEGEEVGGYKLQKIDARKVILERDSELKEIPLVEEEAQ